MSKLRNAMSGLDIRRALPLLAQAGLQIVNHLQRLELFQFLDVLVAFQECRLEIEHLKWKLAEGVLVMGALPDDVRNNIIGMVASAVEDVVAELRAHGSPAIEVHLNIICDGCGLGPIIGPRYACKACPNFDLCSHCHDQCQKVHPRHSDWMQLRCETLADVVDFSDADAPVPDECIAVPLSRNKREDLEDNDDCWVRIEAQDSISAPRVTPSVVATSSRVFQPPPRSNAVQVVVKLR